MAAKTRLVIPRGATFRKLWTWLSIIDMTKAVSGVTRGYPTTLTAVDHDMPDGEIPVALLDLGDLITLDDSGLPSADPKFRRLALKIDDDTFTIKVDSTEFAAYTSGGYVVYRIPKDLTGATARAQFRTDADAEEALLELTTENDGLVLGGTEGTVEMVLSESQATDIGVDEGADSGEWNIEIELPLGDTIRFKEGTFEMTPDVTRPLPP